MTRRSRSQIVELIKATMPWEEVSVQSLEPEASEIYRHRKDALERYMKGDTIESIKHATTIDGSYLKKMIKRCLTVAPDRFVYGYRALLPNVAIKAYQRKKKVDPSLWQTGAGLSGVLGAIFERYPDLEPELRKLILRKISKEKKPNNKKSRDGNPKNNKIEVQGFAYRSKDVHAAFIDLLEKKGLPKTEWPFNTMFHGLRTLSGYVSRVREENYEAAVYITGDRGAIAHIPTGTGYRSLTKSTGLMEAVEIDSHTIDDMFVLALQHEDGLETYHIMKKLHLLAAVDSRTAAALWYYVVHGDDVTAEDVVALIRQMLSPELPKPKFTLGGLKLYSGAGFPADVIPEMRQAQPSFFRLDNALAHLANKVSNDLRKQIGCINEYGVPGRPERRPNIEHAFKCIATDLFQRFPNTTGAGPDNGRPMNPDLAAIKYQIKSDELDQLVYAHFANSNAEPTERLRSLSPLEAVAQLVAKEHYIPRRPPLDMRESIGNIRVKIPRTVKGGVDDGHRPYINFKKARYTSGRLIGSPELIGEKVIIEVNELDIRVVEGFLANGSPIGPLTVQGTWAEIPHSLKTRDEINSLLSRRILVRISGECPVMTFKRHLEANLEAAATNNKQDTRSATKLDKLRSEQSQSTIQVEGSAQFAVSQESAPPSIEVNEVDEISDSDSLVTFEGLDLYELVEKL